MNVPEVATPTGGGVPVSKGAKENRSPPVFNADFPDTGANINITNSIQNLNTDFPIYKRSNSVSGVGGGVNVTAKGTMTVSWLDDHDRIQTYNRL